MTTIDTEIGKVSWSGDLGPDTEVTLPSGNKTLLSNWATMTNGDCFRIIEEGKFA